MASSGRAPRGSYARSAPRLRLARSSRVTARFVRMLRRAQNGGPGDLRWLGIRRLTVGKRGRDVRLLQKDLTKLGYPASSDGQFGPQTRSSVRAFERAAGLTVDGVMTLREARTLKKVARSGPQAGAVSQSTGTTGRPTPPTSPTHRRLRRSRPARSQRRASRCRHDRRERPRDCARLRARRPPSASSSPRATPSPGSRTSTAAGTRASRTRRTTARDPSATRSRPPASSARRWRRGRSWAGARPGPASGSRSTRTTATRSWSSPGGASTRAARGGGTRWTRQMRPTGGYVARHPAGL